MPVNYYTEDCRFTFRGKGKTSAWIRETAHQEGWKSGAISVIFCSDAYLLQINNQYLNHNYFTDIITFDYSDCDARTIAGDLMISLDTVRDNANTFGISFENELQRVIIHGVIHLCGYGDKTPAEEKQMKNLENKYLAQFYDTTQDAPRKGASRVKEQATEGLDRPEKEKK